MRDLLEELQRRKDQKIYPCESCDASGMYQGTVCTDCLGQGTLLTRTEYDAILGIAYAEDDNILIDEFLN